MNKLINAIENKQFEEASILIKKLDVDDFIDFMEQQAFSEENPIYYDFLNYCIAQSQTNLAEYHYLASEMLVSYFDEIIDEAYNKAYIHTNEALLLSPNNIDYKEQMLQFFSLPPDCPKLSEISTFKLCIDILREDPHNETAQELWVMFTAEPLTNEMKQILNERKTSIN